MYNKTFHEISINEKKKKLARVISFKGRMLSDEQLELILSKLDLQQQYYIKVLRKPEKFLNSISEETIVRDGVHILSRLDIVYGSLRPGHFFNREGVKEVRSGHMDVSIPAAVVQVRSSMEKSKVDEVHTLFLYQPETAV